MDLRRCITEWSCFVFLTVVLYAETCQFCIIRLIASEKQKALEVVPKYHIISGESHGCGICPNHSCLLLCHPGMSSSPSSSPSMPHGNCICAFGPSLRLGFGNPDLANHSHYDSFLPVLDVTVRGFRCGSGPRQCVSESGVME